MRVIYLSSLLSIFFIFSTTISRENVNYNNKIDLIVFSFNRPLQLYAFLESIYKYTSHLNNIYVLYRSENIYNKAYLQVQDTFSDVIFVMQGSNPKKDFKPLLIKCFDDSSSDYVVFGVDDIIVKDYINFNICIRALEKNNAYAFCLRLGKNIIKNNYFGRKLMFDNPPFEEIGDNICKFRFNAGLSYWAYPNNLDMTIYKKSEIAESIKKLNYSSPNRLEGSWANDSQTKRDKCKFGLCFDFSKVVNTPLNLVQQDWRNPHENSFSAKTLLKKWNEGLKIDIDHFFMIKNECPHIGDKPIFIMR